MGWTFARNFLTANTGPIYQLKDADINAIVSVRHGVWNGALLRTFQPSDAGDSCARKRWPSTRRSHIDE